MSSIEEQAAEIDRQELEEKERERLLGKPVEIELELKEKQVSRSHSVRETFAKLVWVRIEFCSIGDIDTVNEKYQAEVRIKAKWYEDDGSINEYDKKTRWYPKLFIENALDNVKEEITYSVTHVEDKCMITETRIAKGYFWERMELQNFPLDIQELSITLASKYSPRKVQLIADPIRISNLYGEAIYTFRDQQKWKLYKICRVTQKASYDLTKEEAKNLLAECNPINPVINEACHMNMSIAKSTKRPKFVASCFCSRKPDYYLYNCFAFNFLITALSLTIFLIDVKLAPNRITGTFTLILTSVSFRWTTSKILPTLAYLTSLDKYQMICILYLVMCCVFHSSFAVMHLDLEKKEFINKIGLACYASVLITIQIAFLIGLILGWQKIKKIQHEEKLFLQDMQKKYIDYQLSDDEDD